MSHVAELGTNSAADASLGSFTGKMAHHVHHLVEIALNPLLKYRNDSPCKYSPPNAPTAITKSIARPNSLMSR